ncbi:tRNA lysidine(34) synthetase TilS [Thermomonas sp.]|uniref:tRNA lysidine(34) synthetase TilS n=1 Tax=Thermomonas sp. TaxID=1971895 RepID=UPI00248866E0|nr:tRNA lysidine(34) synthetase TilS [Thermomonas sp.]MDI1252096.1 tRNA lysidine(34) synthetase TilS [Thermomonas sp.]
MSALPDLVGRTLLVGYSGGLDSTVLLHKLVVSNPARLRAIHVHHGLHADADAWAAHCQRSCDSLGIELIVERVQVEGNGLGREAAARVARHAAFAHVLRDGEVLALAHHRDDQAETFLLRALRGSSVDGLAAMRPWRVYANGWLWRPLLETSRDALREYAGEHDLSWIEDPGNEDASLDRNFLRMQLMPLLRTRWPQADAAFARSAALSAEASDLLDTGDHIALASASNDGGTLAVDALQALPAARRARVLRRWVAQRGLPPLPANGVASIEGDLLGASTDGEARFEWAGACIQHWHGQLHAQLAPVPMPGDWTQEWDGSEILQLPTGAKFELTGAARFDTPLRVHARQGGERILLPGRTHHHALKHVLQDRGIPPWRRSEMPLLTDVGGVLQAAGDSILSGSLDAWLQARGARLHWRAPAW